MGGVLFSLERTTLQKKSTTDSVLEQFELLILVWMICKTLRTNTRAAAYETSGVEWVLTSWQCNRARSQRAWRRPGARSSTWWWTSCCCDPLSPTLGRWEGTAQNQSVYKDRTMLGAGTSLQHVLMCACTHIHIHTDSDTVLYLPEPAPLQDGEGAPQQLQDDVATVEDLQAGNQSLTKDGIEQQQMDMDVQHTSSMEMVEEKKSCRSKWKLLCSRPTLLLFCCLSVMLNQ